MARAGDGAQGPDYSGDDPLFPSAGIDPIMADDHSTTEDRFDDDPERVRPLLASMPSGPWRVFETFAADGSLAIGISSTPLPPGSSMVVYEALTKDVAELAAAGLHRWRRRRAVD